MSANGLSTQQFFIDRSKPVLSVAILLCLCADGFICGVCFLSLQYNLNGSNTGGSFTVDDSNSFCSPYKILPIAQENKYLGIFS